MVEGSVVFINDGEFVWLWFVVFKDGDGICVGWSVGEDFCWLVERDEVLGVEVFFVFIWGRGIGFGVIGYKINMYRKFIYNFYCRYFFYLKVFYKWVFKS